LEKIGYAGRFQRINRVILNNHNTYGLSTTSFGGRKAIDRLQNADEIYNPQQEPKKKNAVVSPSTIRELQKDAGILELLELMEEAHKDKTRREVI